MKKVTRTAEETRQYLSQHQNLIDFVNELHEYLKKHMRFYIGDDGGKYWGCGYNRPETDRVKLIKHFIKFCNRKRLEWTTVDDMFMDKDSWHWCICDCDYLYKLKVNELGQVVVEDERETYFLNQNEVSNQ